VIDSEGNESIESTKVTVYPCGWPQVDGLSPNDGPLSGGDEVTITGSGFSTAISVQFGLVQLSGNEINVVDDNTIKVVSPYSGIGVPAAVSVTTSSPQAESNSQMFTYFGDPPIVFDIAKLTDFANPTTVAFGPDGKLYAGNTNGQIGRFTLNEDYTAVITVNVISQVVVSGRAVMGM
jgi:hypothetical protein